jgi:hypothetical protein
MSQNFEPGDFLVFQLEAGFGLLRLLAVDEENVGKTWHIAAYDVFFPDVEGAEAATVVPNRLTPSYPHLALTGRAFESTQVAKVANIPLSEKELEPLSDWKSDPSREIYDRSVRLLLGIR